MVMIPSYLPMHRPKMYRIKAQNFHTRFGTIKTWFFGFTYMGRGRWAVEGEGLGVRPKVVQPVGSCVWMCVSACVDTDKDTDMDMG